MAYMDYINKAQMTTTDEILSSFEWEVSVDHAPAVVYWPSEALIQLRTREVTPPADLSNEIQRSDFRGYQVLSTGLTTNTGQLVFNYQDFEDQSFYAFCVDSIYKSNNPLTRRCYRKKDIYANYTLRRLNIDRLDVRDTVCQICLPASIVSGDVYNNQRTPIQNGSLTYEVQVFWQEILN